MNDAVSRRGFLRVTTAAGAIATVWRPADALARQSDGAQATPPAAGSGWFDEPMRWVQLTLVENDPGRFDPAFWLDYFGRLKADAACLSAGGIVAYYPTEVPLHHRSTFLGTTDPFGDLVRGCRARGMRVLARTDPHAARDDVRAAHPDWIAADRDGQPIRHWANPDLWVTCALGPYNFDFMTMVHREIVTMYGVDGIFVNRWNSQRQCYCVHCRENFKAATGLDLRRLTSARDDTRIAFLDWQKARLTELWKHWDAAVRDIRAESTVIPNGPPDMKTAGELSPILFTDYQARHGNTPLWVNGQRAKELRSVMGRRPIGGIFSVGFEEAYRWKDSVQSEPEVRLWVAEGTANGMRPWVTKFSGVLYDRRWLPVVERIYDWHARHEAYLRNEAPLARVAILYSEQTAARHTGVARGDVPADHVRGMYQALLEARVPFEFVHEAYLTPARLDPFTVLVLADAAALSDDQCAAIRAFVHRGGSLVATFASSLYDEHGAIRKDFGLADLFGVSFAGGFDGPMMNSYLSLDADPSTGRRHEILAGLDDTPRIINGVFRVRTSPTAAFPSPVTLIPSYPDLPMEDVYPRVLHTEMRELYLRQIGDGRVVYFPWDIDRTFWEVLAVDHGRLLANAIRWAAAGHPSPVEVSGPGLLDIAVWRQKTSLTVHLVNLTNPMMMRGPLREVVPIGPLEVRMELPAGATAKRVQLLTAGSTVPVRQSGRTVTVSVPSVDVHEVVAIDV
jgi:hypothetical protein